MGGGGFQFDQARNMMYAAEFTNRDRKLSMGFGGGFSNNMVQQSPDLGFTPIMGSHQPQPAVTLDETIGNLA